jgi:hypothetical protein
MSWFLICVYCKVYVTALDIVAPELWATEKWILLHDTVQPHTSLSVREFTSVHQIAVFATCAIFSRFVTFRFFLSHD